MRRPSAWLGWIALCGLAAPAYAADALAPKPVLTERVYWRQFYASGMMRLSPSVLKTEADKWLSAKLIKRLERDTTRRHPAARADWRDLAVCEMRRDIADAALPLVPTTFPPDDWMKPAFDDSTWIRQRIAPLPYHRSALFQDCFNRAIFLRTTFLVPDPAKAKGLRLQLVYRGGIRVFLNGSEIARAHLPKGAVASDTPGADYPEDAYRAYIDEVTQPNKGRRCIPDLRCPFDSAPRPKSSDSRLASFRDAFRGAYLNRKGWVRMSNLRDRRLGPVTLPAALLRKGPNVLAIAIHGSPFHPIIMAGAGGERFSSANWTAHGGFANLSWAHARLIRAELTDPAGAVPPATARPKAAQVWVEDPHTRLYAADYNQPGAPVGRVRMVGGLNGICSAQVAVGTDKELAGLHAAPTDLKGPGGAVIPASAITVSYLAARPLSELGSHGYARGMGCGPNNSMSRDTALYVGKPMAQVRYFDNISAERPARVPARSCQPVWLTVRVPPAAAPGPYTGSLRIQAKALPPVTVPVRLQVFAWRVPDPLDFQTEVMLEQSPYGIARRYKCPLWSDQHFRLIESAFRQLARVGNDVLYIPVIHRTEFGNLEDSMIKWIRRKDGTLAFDYTILDRYLDLAVKHLGAPPVISFAVMHCMMASAPPTVTLTNQATGRTEKVDLSWKGNPFGRVPMWTRFAGSLLDHMRRRGLGRAVYWGHAGDAESDPALIAMFSELFPHTYWTASPHSRRGGSGGGGHHPEIFRAMSEIYARPYTAKSHLGWLLHQQGKNVHNPLCPRQELSGMSLPYTFRLMPDRAMHLGYTGIGRLGFDYFDHTWLNGYRGGDWNPSGIPCFTLGSAGAKAVESTARFEALIEGLQDAELRIFLEQAVAKKAIPDKLAAEATTAVYDRFRGALCPQFREAGVAINTVGWQARCRRVYQVAEKVAAHIGLDVDRTAAEVDVPALGTASLTLKLRNWTGKPRAWKAAGSAPWLAPDRTAGSASGHDALRLTVNAAGKKPGDTLAGTVSVTDVATGTTSKVKLTARVTTPMELFFDHPNFNIAVGGTETREFRLVNHTTAQQAWSLSSPADWLRIEPGSGKLAPGGQLFVRLTAAPTDKGAARHPTSLTFTAAGGLVKQTVNATCFVIPPYKDPGELPYGRILRLEKIDRKMVKSHRVLARGDKKPTYDRGVLHGHSYPLLGHQYRGIQPVIGKKRFSRAMWVAPHHQTVFALQGTGIGAFSASVGVPIDAARKLIRSHHRRINFEIHVDGKVVAQSGLMCTTDPPRLMVVKNLDKAKEMKLVTRLDSNQDCHNFLAVWANAEFYKTRR